MSLSPEAAPSARGLPRLRHRISNLFRHKSYSTASTATSAPVTPVNQQQEAEHIRPVSRRTAKDRKARNRRSKQASVVDARVPSRRSELPQLASLDLNNDFELHVPYLNFEPSRSGNHIDWEKELDILHKRDSKYEPDVVVKAISEPNDDDIVAGKAGNITYRSNESRSGVAAQEHQVTEASHHDVCSECHRPKTGGSASASPLNDLINSTTFAPRDDANKRMSQATTAASIPYLSTEQNHRMGSSRGSPALPDEPYYSRPTSVASGAAQYKKSPALSTGRSGGAREAPASVAAVKRRWEVKTDNLLQPVDNSKTSAADSVSKTIEAINTGEIGSALSKDTAASRARSNSSSKHGLGLGIASLHDSSITVSKPSSIVPTPTASRRQSLGYDSERLAVADKRRSLNSATSGHSPTMPDSGAPGSDTRGRGYSTLPPPSRNTSTASANRRSSSRISGDRLSWVRSLEDNNPRLNSQEGKVFRKLEGGVAAKLAKFEQQKNTSAPASFVNGNKVARSDSSNSRTSDGTGSFVPPNLTRRTTIESTSNGSPSLAPATEKTAVMTKFDESFQQKMELLAGSLADKADKNGPKAKPSTQSLRHALPAEDSAPVTVDTQARENHQAMLGDILKLKARPSQVGLAAGSVSISSKQSVENMPKESNIVDAPPAPAAKEVSAVEAVSGERSFNAAMLPLFA